MYLELKRLADNGEQTIGTLKLFDFNKNVILKLDTLELPWLQNQRQISCIPLGMYIVSHTFSIRFGRCLKIVNVSGRDGILIHSGNFSSQTKGCILVGKGKKDINFDEQIDLLNSKLALSNLLNSLKDISFLTLTIRN